MRRVALCLLLVLLPLIAASAHPHLWIDGTVGLTTEGSTLTGLEVEWLFDEFNSADMIFSFDEDLNGTFSDSEVEFLRLNAFDHLRQADYFTLMFQGIGRVEVGDATEFSAEIRDGRLVYSFTIPLDIQLLDANNLTVALFDPSYFIDFVTEPEQESYLSGIRFAGLDQETLQLQTQGWGVVSVPAVRLRVQ